MFVPPVHETKGEIVSTSTEDMLLDAPEIVPEKKRPLPQKPKKIYVSQGTLVDRIIFCESRGNPNAKNKYSSASGLGQFINSTWKAYAIEMWGTSQGHDVFDPIKNRAMVEYVISRYGTKDWNASRHCWNKMV